MHIMSELLSPSVQSLPCLILIEKVCCNLYIHRFGESGKQNKPNNFYYIIEYLTV